MLVDKLKRKKKNSRAWESLEGKPSFRECLLTRIQTNN